MFIKFKKQNKTKHTHTRTQKVTDETQTRVRSWESIKNWPKWNYLMARCFNRWSATLGGFEKKYCLLN